MSMPTAILDTDGGFLLTDGGMDTSAYAAIGRYYVLRGFVLKQGPYLKVTAITKRRLARDLGLSVEEFENFVELCCEAEYFHAGFWASDQVLTSKSIQEAWKAAKKRGYSPDQCDEWLLLDDDRQAGNISDINTTKDADDTTSGEISTTNDADETTKEEIFPANDATDATNVELAGNISDINPNNSEIYPDYFPRKSKSKSKSKSSNPLPGTESQVESEFSTIETDVEGRQAQSASQDDEVRPPGACLMQEIKNRAFQDGEGSPHRTAYGALEARYQQKTGKRDFQRFITQICELCPAGCRASPDDVRECHALMARGISEGNSPLRLVKHILREERGERT